MDLSHQNPTLDVVFNFVFSLIQFIHSSLRKKVQLAIVGSLFPDVITLLLDEWVNPSLPNDISELDKLEGIKRQVDLILDQLKTFKWPGHTELQTWKDQLNRTWLNQRKSASLDSVRKALASAKGGLRQVERVEKQMMAAQAQVHHHDPEEDNVDWDASWEEEEKQKVASPTAAKSTNDNEEDASGWGFDDDDDTTENVAEDNKKQAPEDDDAGDAWGWGDDEQEEQKTQEDSSPTTKRTNGSKKEPVTEEEVVLREHYSITEVPDHLLEIIGRDIADAQALQATENNHLDTAIAARGLLALPTLALAMFRATAPSYYGASPALTDIHRYNDSLYIAEKLRDLGPDTSIYNISADIEAMEKFARLAYAKEMETQRVIIWDLLEGAQGFTSCTQFPYSQEIENAVSSVVDRIRTLHREWQPILSPSALSQSIGAMLAMVIGKVIHSIEEMDDISEPESHRLTAFCQQIASLDDLFHQTPPFDTNITGTGSTPASVSLTAVYVPSWLRFQYLINILESSLVDIKYLWTEGELSLEFSQREVVSLIQALFTESTHRRNAINAVLGKKGPLDRQEY
jgi:centromere/kinetochore protein ZW10